MAYTDRSDRELRKTKRLLEAALAQVKREQAERARLAADGDGGTVATQGRMVRSGEGPTAADFDDTQHAGSAETRVITGIANGQAETETLERQWRAPAVALRTTSAATSTDDMPTVAVPLGSLSAAKAPPRRARLTRNPKLVSSIKRVLRKTITWTFGLWIRFSTAIARQLHWFPMVKPYVGYGTEEYSRLVCRTILAPADGQPNKPMRGIHAMLEVPAPGQCVQIDIDGVPLRTVQVGTMEVYDPVDSARSVTMDYSVSDSSGYLDLLAEHRLEPGVHMVSCGLKERPAVEAELFTIPSTAKVGVISDVDDTCMVTQVPTLWKAVYNMLFLSPHKRASVPGMAVMYNKIASMFPGAPFFYLSTSPWNVENSIRNFLKDYGFPDGPLLLRDLDPRPKTFVPSGVQHKLEYAEQLMEDFPNMKFILIGDDGQKDPTTYAEIARRYPGRVLAIGIRQLSPKESGGFGTMSGFSTTQPVPVTDVPVFTGTTGSNIMKTMLPYLQQFM